MEIIKFIYDNWMLTALFIILLRGWWFYDD